MAVDVQGMLLKNMIQCKWLGRECPVLVQSVTDRDSDNDDEDEFQGIQQACTVVL